MTPTVDVEKANRQCWDCLKRRLVCDFTLPHCKKCSKNGRQCSGYDEKKPLQWVEPGHILSRKRRKPPPKEQATTMRSPRIRELEKDCSSDEHSGETSGQYTEALTKEYTDIVAAASKAQAVSYIGEVLDICDRITIKLIVSGKRQDEAQKILKHRAKSPEKALMILEHLLHVLETEDIPTYNLRNDAADAVQAVHYCAKPTIPHSCFGKIANKRPSEPAHVSAVQRVQQFGAQHSQYNLPNVGSTCPPPFHTSYTRLSLLEPFRQLSACLGREAAHGRKLG